MTAPSVFIDKLAQDAQALEKQFLDAFAHIRAAGDFQKARAVFLKPNLTYPSFKAGVVTRLEFIGGFIAAFRRINPGAGIFIGEGEGGYNAFSMDAAMRAMGYFDLESAFPRVKVVNVSKLPARTVELSTSKGPYAISLPEIFFDTIDLSISFPVPKVHCMTKLSLSYKNQWGCLPDRMRLKDHYMFDFVIPRIAEALKFKYAFLDGKYALDRNGPLAGEPRETGWFAASNSLGAFDMIVAELMGFDWRTVGHLRTAAAYGLMPGRDEIEVLGPLESLKTRFALKRNFWNYPALAAFRSKGLTRLFYFSRWAKPLHKFMHTVRKRQIA